MFDKEYIFYGKHAQMVNQLTSRFNDDIRSIFSTNIAVYKVAPVIGVMNGKKAEVDKSGNDIKTTKIFRDKMLDEADNLKSNFRWIMCLLYGEQKSNEEMERLLFELESDDIARAPYDEEYNRYVLGGVEVLHEKIFSGEASIDNYLKNLFDMLTIYNERYYK